jgi:hypothetical protein
MCRELALDVPTFSKFLLRMVGTIALFPTFLCEKSQMCRNSELILVSLGPQAMESS